MTAKAISNAIVAAALAGTMAAEPAAAQARSERYERGLAALQKVDGETGVQVVETIAKSFPDFATYLVEFPFGDIYSRPGLGLRERELVVVGALTAMGTAGPQLRVHIDAALHVGCTPREIVEVVMQMSVYAGFPAALNGLAAVREVFGERGIQLPVGAG
jgi:4-carboxymuconolactone decarboxylase